MSRLNQSIKRITSLEELTLLDTPIHRQHPAIKLLLTVLYLITVISFPAEQISGLMVFILYPVLLMTIGELPFKTVLGRLVIALPFSVFAGLSNMFVSREVRMMLGGIIITQGMITFASILIKTILTVSAVLILIATTSMRDLISAMLYFHIPTILVMQLIMTFRYLGVLISEISVMYHAYLLRAPLEKGIKLKDMGSFLGQLILRSFDRSERIFHAMKCRGFEGGLAFSERRRIPTRQWIGLVLFGGVFILFRLINISEVLGELIVSIFDVGH